MSSKRGRILIRLDNIQVADPGADVRQKTDQGFRALDNEQLVFVLHRLMLEMNRRSMILTDH
jgi:hypothetical protein